MKERKKMRLRKLILLVLTFLPATIYPQEFPGKAQIDYELKGSVPPVPGWFECIGSLGGKPFNRREADQCLQSILSHPHLTGGKVIVKPERNYTQVSFILESPPLALSKVDFGLPPGLELGFAEFISRDKDVLRTGDTYDPFREADTGIKLNQFLRSKGIVAIVSKDVALDYDHETASLLYKLWEGPNTIEEEPLLPNGKKCDVYVGNLNEIDIDDYTPLPLVDSILGIRRARCFSSDAIEKAKRQLNRTDLFSSIEVKTSDSGEWRDVSVSARTKPTKVSRTLCKWYGILAEPPSPGVPSIPLAENQIYKRSDALKSRDVLVDFFTKPGLKVKVSEEIMLEPDHKLTVVFHVLAGRTDTLSIDGNEIR
jgi:hypothetical protein